MLFIGSWLRRLGMVTELLVPWKFSHLLTNCSTAVFWRGSLLRCGSSFLHKLCNIYAKFKSLLNFWNIYRGTVAPLVPRDSSTRVTSLQFVNFFYRPESSKYILFWLYIHELRFLCFVEYWSQEVALGRRMEYLVLHV